MNDVELWRVILLATRDENGQTMYLNRIVTEKGMPHVTFSYDMRDALMVRSHKLARDMRKHLLRLGWKMKEVVIDKKDLEGGWR